LNPGKSCPGAKKWTFLIRLKRLGVLGDDNLQDTQAELLELLAEREVMETEAKKAVERDHLRHHRSHEHLNGAFGGDKFGQQAEKFARFFGTPKFIIWQTVIVVLWITLNSVGFVQHWDVYPFILLNLCFSTQAAYAAPLILLAQTRQADRDKATADSDAKHREELSQQQTQMIEADTAITRTVLNLQEQQMTTLSLITDIHGKLIGVKEKNNDPS
jgi:uncharacterized membrane protein